MHEYFLGLIGAHDLFIYLFNFPLCEYIVCLLFFLYFARPRPISFLMVRAILVSCDTLFKNPRWRWKGTRARTKNWYYRKWKIMNYILLSQ